MRNFLITYFALNYTFVLFRKRFSYKRAANVIFPLGVMNGAYLAHTGTYSFDTFMGVVLLVLFLLSLFIAFVYFNYIKPVKYSELTELQKWYYGFIKPITMTETELREWNHIKDYYEDIFHEHSSCFLFYNTFPFLVQWMIVGLSLAYIFI